jgi:poly [ADP-ribose] polymerase 1
VEGIDLLRWEDQEKIRKYIDDGSSVSVPADASSSTSVSNEDCAIDVSPSSRASCKKCNEKIQKGTVCYLFFF